MSDVTIRELRNKGGDVVERVTHGEVLTVTRDGRPVARLMPLPGPTVPTLVLRQRWSHLPPMAADALRRDLDDIVDPTL